MQLFSKWDRNLLNVLQILIFYAIEKNFALSLLEYITLSLKPGHKIHMSTLVPQESTCFNCCCVLV